MRASTRLTGQRESVQLSGGKLLASPGQNSANNNSCCSCASQLAKHSHLQKPLSLNLQSSCVRSSSDSKEMLACNVCFCSTLQTKSERICCLQEHKMKVFNSADEADNMYLQSAGRHDVTLSASSSSCRLTLLSSATPSLPPHLLLPDHLTAPPTCSLIPSSLITPHSSALYCSFPPVPCQITLYLSS